MWGPLSVYNFRIPVVGRNCWVAELCFGIFVADLESQPRGEFSILIVCI